MWPDIRYFDDLDLDEVEDDDLLTQWEIDFIASVGEQEFEPT